MEAAAEAARAALIPPPPPEPETIWSRALSIQETVRVT